MKQHLICLEIAANLQPNYNLPKLDNISTGNHMGWWSHIATFLAGLGAGWTLKVAISNRSSRSHRTTIVSQKGNKAGGDIVGGDMHKGNRK